MKRSWLALLGLLAAAPLLWAALSHVQQREAAWELVMDAATAHERVSYRGQAAWHRGRWKKPVEVTHDAGAGLTRYDWGRFSYVRGGPSSRQPDPAAWCLDRDALRENYRAREGAPTRILRRRARTAILESRHPGRPEIHLTIDAETGLPLKVVSLRPDGTLYRTLAYREIAIGPQSITAEPPKASWFGTRVSPDRVEAEAGFALLRPAYVPRGFRCIDARIKDWASKEVTLTYSDGATAFDLKQHLVLTPAQMETNLERRLGARKAQFHMRMYLGHRRRALAASDGGAEDGAVVHCSRRFMHRSYRLRADDRDVKLLTRGDLAEEESLKVLRSLRRR